MTCIAAIAEKGAVYMAGDRATGTEGGALVRQASPKIVRRGALLFGACGTSRLGDVLHFAPKVPEPPARGSLDAFMTLRFARWAREAHAEHGLETKVDGRHEMEGMLLVGVRGQLYIVDGQYAASRVEGYEAIGSGGEAACGALFATKGQPAEKRLRLAMEAAAHHCTTVCGPFDMLVLGEPGAANKALREAWAYRHEARKRKAG